MKDFLFSLYYVFLFIYYNYSDNIFKKQIPSVPQKFNHPSPSWWGIKNPYISVWDLIL